MFLGQLGLQIYTSNLLMRVVSENNVKPSSFLSLKWKFIHYFEILISAVKYECINTDRYESAFNNPLEFITTKYSVLASQDKYTYCLSIDCSMEIALRHVKRNMVS